MNYFVAFGLLALVLILIVAIGVLRGRGEPGAATADTQSCPYQKKRFLFSKAEKSFYLILAQALPEDYVLFAKVRLCDVIEVRPDARKRGGHANKITAKHVDFLICDRQWLEPRLAVELDDASHARPDRQKRDEFLENAARAAGLPLLRVPARSSYDVKALRDSIVAGIAGDQSPTERLAETPLRR